KKFLKIGASEINTTRIQRKRIQHPTKFCPDTTIHYFQYFGVFNNFRWKI
ncbi:hypothetical protein X975_01689, partial [Stegodyphus mimosarum]